jgi:hypothetical protein
MDVRDRIQRWWRPAQWKDDHPQAQEDDDPLQATERRRGRKWLPTLLTSEHLEHNDPMRAMVEVERDFKKPR